jgi:hypothetical protein
MRTSNITSSIAAGTPVNHVAIESAMSSPAARRQARPGSGT